MLLVERFASSVVREAAWSDKVTLNGEPFSYKMSFRAENSIRFAQTSVELNLLIDALTPTGDIPTNVETMTPKRSQPTPDFRLTFNKTSIYCECTVAGDPHSFTWQLIIGDWQNQLDTALRARPELFERLDGRYLAFIPTRVPKVEAIPALVSEIIHIIERGEMPTPGVLFGTRVTEQYSELNKLGTVINSNKSGMPLVFIQMPGMASGGPRESVDQLYRSIQRKAGKRYAKFEPIWLIVGASEILWPLDQVVDDLTKRLDTISPFERLYISTSRESFRIRPQRR